jgi:hypothetical protein
MGFAETGRSCLQALRDHAQVQLGWNFALWAHTPDPMQRAVMAVLAEDVRADPAIARSAIGLPRVLDLARLCYPSSSSDDAPR